MRSIMPQHGMQCWSMWAASNLSKGEVPSALHHDIWRYRQSTCKPHIEVLQNLMPWHAQLAGGRTVSMTRLGVQGSPQEIMPGQQASRGVTSVVIIVFVINVDT